MEHSFSKRDGEEGMAFGNIIGGKRAEFNKDLDTGRGVRGERMELSMTQRF